KALRYLTSGYDKDVKQVLNDAMFVEDYDEMVIVKDIDFFSVWDHMMFADRKKVDVLDDHLLVGVLDGHGLVQDLLDVLVVARREVAQRLRDALGRLLEPLAVHVLAELLQELLDQLLDHPTPPSYSKRFFAVSTTATRLSAPVGSAGARIRQNA